MVERHRERQEAFGARLRAAREGHSPPVRPQAIADAIGYKSPGAISNWERGESPPDPDTVFAIERFLELPPGELSQHLGYVPVDANTPPCTVETAIAADPRLDNGARDALLKMFRVLTERAEE